MSKSTNATAASKTVVYGGVVLDIVDDDSDTPAISFVDSDGDVQRVSRAAWVENGL